MARASRRLRQRLCRNDGGNMMIEFALVLPVLCLMLVGMLDLGRFELQKSEMLQGAREGAQYGILAATDSTGINTTAQNATGLGGVTATNTLFYECTSGVSVPAGTVCSGSALKTYLTVNVTKAFSSVLSSGGMSFGTFGSWTAPTSVSASITMICP